VDPEHRTSPLSYPAARWTASSCERWTSRYCCRNRNKVGYVHTAAGASASSGGDGDGGGQDEGEGGGECSGGGSKRKLSEVLPALVAASGGKLTEEVGMWEIDGRSRRGRGRPAATSTCDTLALH